MARTGGNATGNCVISDIAEQKTGGSANRFPASGCGKAGWHGRFSGDAWPVAGCPWSFLAPQTGSSSRLPAARRRPYAVEKSSDVPIPVKSLRTTRGLTRRPQKCGIDERGEVDEWSHPARRLPGSVFPRICGTTAAYRPRPTPAAPRELKGRCAGLTWCRACRAACSTSGTTCPGSDR